MSFTPTTIAQQVDGIDLQTSLAQVMIQQGAATFRTSVRPNPEVQINVRTQAQLEAELGVNLVIPDFTTVTVSYDKSFTQTKPFLIGEGAVLETIAPNVETNITYDDTGNTLFQKNTANPIRALITNNLQFTSANGTEIFVDELVGTSRLFIDDTRIANFAKIGIVEFPFVRFNSIAPVNVGIGLILRRCTTLVMRASLLRNPAANGTTFISIITDGVPISVLVDDSLTSTILPGDRLFYLDPNSPVGTIYSLKDTEISGGGDFYQLGVNTTADIVAASPNGIRLTVTAHGLDIGQVVKLSGFIVNTQNNITTIVTDVIDANTVDVDGIFGGTETGGNLDANSLNSTSVLVSSRDNSSVPDSMSHAEARTSRTLEVDGSGGIDVPIVDIAPVLGDWIPDINDEEFTLDTTTGLYTYIGIADKTKLIQYQLTATPTSGPSQIIDFDLHINGIIQPKATRTLDTATATEVTFIGGLFVLSNGDTIQLFKDNQTNTNNTNVLDATNLITAS